MFQHFQDLCTRFLDKDRSFTSKIYFAFSPAVMQKMWCEVYKYITVCKVYKCRQEMFALQLHSLVMTGDHRFQRSLSFAANSLNP